MTNFETQINQALKAAMLAKDQVRLRTIRAIKSEILLANTDGGSQEVDEARGLQIVQRMLKQRRDSQRVYAESGRDDLAATEAEEIAVLESFLPSQLAPEALDAALRQLIAELGASGPRDMGKVIGAANKALSGQAEGRAIAEAVKRLLAEG